MSAYTRIQAFIGDTVKLTLTDGSVLKGVVVSLGITRGVAIRPNLSSDVAWPFPANDVQNIEVIQ